MSLEKLKVEDIYEEIYRIAKNSYSDEARLTALSVLLNYKREEDYRAERQEALAKLVSSITNL